MESAQPSIRSASHQLALACSRSSRLWWHCAARFCRSTPSRRRWLRPKEFPSSDLRAEGNLRHRTTPLPLESSYRAARIAATTTATASSQDKNAARTNAATDDTSQIMIFRSILWRITSGSSSSSSLNTRASMLAFHLPATLFTICSLAPSTALGLPPARLVPWRDLVPPIGPRPFFKPSAGLSRPASSA